VPFEVITFHVLTPLNWTSISQQVDHSVSQKVNRSIISYLSIHPVIHCLNQVINNRVSSRVKCCGRIPTIRRTLLPPSSGRSGAWSS